ncbi:hypothetical protein L3Y34_000268 [Caenorhabditis briggsae]|uniref:SH2 domain-containing protein n=1 Tax=Caenorhabditis briggsae TaxID=6238 RepID=A0AAE9D8X3_CAEBR|nr:hypothetical protein L3Y34_000268 [Caenorhabditis briggsae]
MTILLQRRRFSALIDQIRTWTSSIKSDKQYRSLSTGDLVTTTKTPSEFESDFMEMDFGSTPTTSSLPSHFDDCDLVPMEFKKNGVKLLKQGSKKAMSTKKYGSSGDLTKLRVEDIHKAQSWFFLDVDPRSAERILMSDGFLDASFLISFFRGKYVLSVLKGHKVEHLVIREYQKKNRSTAFQLDVDRSFKNLLELTDYYKKNKSYVLCTKLSRGVRPRKNQDVRSRA